MNNVFILIQITLTIVLIYLLLNNNTNKSKKIVVNRENKKEMEILKKMRAINLTMPLTEKSRPEKFEEVIGQEKGIKALRAALCGANPQYSKNKETDSIYSSVHFTFHLYCL